ncbi:phage tail assembly protein [Microbulbifer sp. PSTR4-B]|uniref:phage tail assembly protein n=1 Tax=unclassified Microbulbifer TaxID=2619833 RepID=UPI00403AE000
MTSQTKATEQKLLEETIELDFPVEHQGATYEVLIMRRPTVRDLLNIERLDNQSKRKKQEMSDLEKAVNTYASLCEVSPQVIEQLSTSDFKQLDEQYEDFLS